MHLHSSVGPSTQMYTSNYWLARAKSCVSELDCSSSSSSKHPDVTQSKLELKFEKRINLFYYWLLISNVTVRKQFFQCNDCNLATRVEPSWSRQSWRSLTLQEVHVQVLPADGDGVEALRGLHVHLRAAGGPAAQQAGLSGSVQTQNQNLGSSRLQRLWLEWECRMTSKMIK